MPEGEIESYDSEEQHGTIVPEDDEDPIPFSYDDVTDRHVGERITPGQRVVYEVDDMDDIAVSIRRVTATGYG